MLAPGDKIKTWTVERCLGQGASGTVYLARGPSGEPVALKVLEVLGRASRRRIDTELEVLSRLDHPLVVRLLERGELRGRIYLVMEFIPGDPLDKLLERDGPMPPRRAVELAEALARALAHCHRTGVLHRDLKPSNVVVDPTGQPRLVDFGLARDLDAGSRVTREGQFIGTPGFWSPEQARGQTDAIDVRTDVYGVGAVLYALLTGKPPIEGESLLELLERTERLVPVPPSARQPGIDPLLDQIVLRCLEKDPARRPPDADALARELAGWLQGQRRWRKARRRRWRWVLGLLLIPALGALWFDLDRRGRRRRAEDLFQVGAAARDPAPVLSALSLVESRSFRLLGAELLASRGRTAEALELLDVELARDPDWIEGLILRAEVSLARNDPARARHDLDRAVGLDPRSARARRLRAQARAGDDREGALVDLGIALTIDPGDPSGWYERAVLRRAQGELAGAIADLEQALRLPGAPRAQLLCELGVFLEQAGDLAGARARHLEAAERGWSSSVHALGRLRQARGELQELELEMGRLIRLADGPAQRTWRARARLAQGDLDGARLDAASAADLALAARQPLDEPLGLLARIEMDAGRPAEAELALTRALDQASEDTALQHRLGRAAARIELRRQAEAEEDLRVVLSRPEGTVRQRAQARVLLGVLRYRSGRFADALHEYERALELEPANLQANLELAAALMELGRRQDAIEHLRAAAGRVAPADRDRVRQVLTRLEAD